MSVVLVVVIIQWCHPSECVDVFISVSADVFLGASVGVDVNADLRHHRAIGHFCPPFSLELLIFCLQPHSLH